MTETASQARTPLTRIVDGAELPVPGTYAIDASHSAVEFVVRHFFGITKVRGRFSAFDGVIEIAEGPEESTVTVGIDLRRSTPASRTATNTSTQATSSTSRTTRRCRFAVPGSPAPTPTGPSRAT